MSIELIKQDLRQAAQAEKIERLQKYFKTGLGEYGEGDIFIGVTVPDQRKIAKKYALNCSMQEVLELLQHEIHEYRLTALLIMVHKFNKSKLEQEKKEIYLTYLEHLEYVNNWDLVDSSAYEIVGAYLIDKEKDILLQLAEEDHLWKQRIAIIATYYFIKNDQYEMTLLIAEKLLEHPHDIIQKAVGWMLREVGNRAYDVEYNFLKEHYQRMPRTMLRNAIEKINSETRQKFLKGEI